MNAPLAENPRRYFTGKPCKWGHIAERFVSSGTCVECNRTKEDPEMVRQRVRIWARANPEKKGKNQRIDFARRRGMLL